MKRLVSPKHVAGMAQRHDFALCVERLEPWPPGSGLLAVKYLRGKGRSDLTGAAYPHVNGTWMAYSFGSALFRIPATLYKVCANRL